MPNEDEESKIPNLPGYQFFSTDLNYNYFGDQSASTPELLAPSAGPSTPGLLATSAGPSTPGLVAPSAGPSTPGLLATSAGPSTPGLLAPSAGPSTPGLLATSAGPSTPGLLATSAGPSTPGLLATSAGPSIPDLLTTDSLAALTPNVGLVQNSVPDLLALVKAPDTVPKVENESVVHDSASAQNTPEVNNAPIRVAYSLTSDEPEPTFEERVAAMEREIAACRSPLTAPNSTANSTPTPTLAPAPNSTANSTPTPTHAPTPDSIITSVTAPVFVSQETASAIQSEPKWNQYVEPSLVPDVFSSTFNFNRSLLKIFWRIDIDHNNRVSKNELAIALQENWFEGDERVLAKLLYESYEDISPDTIFCDAGLSVNNILSYGPFAEMAAAQLEPQTPGIFRADGTIIPAQNKTNKNNNKKSSQALRSLFKR